MSGQADGSRATQVRPAHSTSLVAELIRVGRVVAPTPERG